MDLQIVFGNPKKKSNKSGGRMAKNKPNKKKPATKAAKKATKKVAKKATKKVAKKATKKVAKKATKKVAKKASKKPVSKRAKSKAAKKPVASKPARKKVAKKASPKRATPKRAKSKKVAKKASPSKAAPRRRRKAKKVKNLTKMFKVKTDKTIEMGKRRVRNNRKNRSKVIASMPVGSSRTYSYASFGANTKGRGSNKTNRLGGTKGAGGLNKVFYNKKLILRKNPFLGGKMNKVEKILKHNVGEAAGLAIGGFASEGINNLVLRYFPKVASMMGGVLGRGTGAGINALVGIGLGVLNEKALKNNPQVDMLAKGIIGSAAVSAGNALYAMTMGRSNMAGFQVGTSQVSRFQSDPSTDFGGFVTGNSSMNGFITGDMGYSSADFAGTADFAGYNYDDSEYDAEIEGDYEAGY